VSLEQWQLFIQIADHGSLTRAAAARDVAQSAVSRQLAAIEKNCGGRLFDRIGRGVVLNEAGARLYPRVVAWLEAGEQLRQDIKWAIREPTGVVRLGVLASIGHDFTGKIFREVRDRFPGIRLRVVDGSGGRLSEWLEAGTIDLALLSRNGKEGRRSEIPLATVSHVLVGPAGDMLTQSPTVALNRLDGLPLVLPGSPNAFRLLLDHWARRKGIALSVRIECDSLPIQKELVAGSGLYTILGAHAVVDEVKAGRLRASRIVSPALNRTITMGMNDLRPPTLACRAVAEIARSHATGLLG
jgi:LysR family nitrogen assimilation transcriptional regulator